MPSSSPTDPWLLILFFLSLPLLHSQSDIVRESPTGTCSDACGNITVKFPFGTGSGCGHPDFARYIKCSSAGPALELSTLTGIYTITSMDYSTNTIIVNDPLMSTCASMHNTGASAWAGRAHSLSWRIDNVFDLLGRSTTSPVFDLDEVLCDRGSGFHACWGLYSCKGVTGIGLYPNAPTSTCCVYNSMINGVRSGNALDLGSSCMPISEQDCFSARGIEFYNWYGGRMALPLVGTFWGVVLFG